MKRVILKDGIIVERRAFSLNVNKNRRYRIILDNEVICSNLLYSDLRYVLKMLRNSMKERKKQWDIQCILWIDSKAVSSGANPLAIFTK